MPVEEDGASSVSSLSLVYGPPSENSLATASAASLAAAPAAAAQTRPAAATGGEFRAAESVPREQSVQARPFPYSPGWYTLELPCHRLKSYFAHLGRFFVSDSEDNVYVGSRQPGGDRVVWRNARFRAGSVRASPCGRIFWRLHRGTAFALKNFNNAESWFEVADGVAEVEVNDWSACLLKEDGSVVLQKDLGPSRPFSDRLEPLPYETRLRCLTMTNRMLLALTEDEGVLVGRVGVSK